LLNLLFSLSRFYSVFDFQNRAIPSGSKKVGKVQGGGMGSAPKIKMSTIQIVDYSEMKEEV